MATTSSLKNVNFMSQDKYNSVEPSDEELYAVNSDNYINGVIADRDNKYDYTAVVTKSTGTEYTAEFTGLLWVFGKEGNGTRTITINGASFNWCYHYGSGYSSGEVQVPLHKGDKFRVNATDSGSNIYFIPAK